MTIRHGSVFVRRASALGGATALVAGASLGAFAPAAFATVNCPAGSVAVSDTVCEVTFTQSGSFTPPAGLSELEALLVGGGGASAPVGNGGRGMYGGGGGEVRIVSLSTSGEVTVTVGAGGLPTARGEQAGSSRVVQGDIDESAAGGYTSDRWQPAFSGLGGILCNDGGPCRMGSGGDGAGGPAAQGLVYNGGEGISPADFGSPLFPTSPSAMAAAASAIAGRPPESFRQRRSQAVVVDGSKA